MANSKAELGSRWASVMDVTGRLVQARENRAAQGKLLASVEVQVQRRRSELEQSLQDIPAVERGKITNRSVSGYRNELRRSTADARAAHVKMADQIRRETCPAKAHYSSPVQMLMREGLGSERRSRISQQIGNSGGVELAALADYAAATRDKELAAALCSRVSTLKVADRTFDPRELADVLVGDDYRRVTAAFMEIDRLSQEAIAANGAFDRSRGNPTSTIQFALMREREAAIGADFSAETPS